jgi:hypothetical protein
LLPGTLPLDAAYNKIDVEFFLKTEAKEFSSSSSILVCSKII